MTYSEFRDQFSTVEQFRWAYGKLTEEEANALITAEVCPTHIKAAMFSTWKQARREVLLRNIRIRLKDDGSLTIIFYEYDSEFDGNDFEYIYSLDAENTGLFLKQIYSPWADNKINIEEWMVKNVNCNGFGSDLKEKWIQMGLHGTYTVFEDYPGGIHRKEEF